MHALAVEYPGYGLYKTSEPNEDQIKEDSLIVYDYLTKVVGLREKDIIVFGRSLGSGPSTYLAQKKSPYCLLLMSPFSSIQNAAKSQLGWASFLGNIVKQRFNNLKEVKNLKCPLLIVHGKQDKVVPHSHSEELFSACTSPCYLHMPYCMSHNHFLAEPDLISPIKVFLNYLQKMEDLSFREE